MKILVLIKHVPDTEAQIKIDPSGKAIDDPPGRTALRVARRRGSGDMRRSGTIRTKV